MTAKQSQPPEVRTMRALPMTSQSLYHLEPLIIHYIASGYRLRIKCERGWWSLIPAL